MTGANETADDRVLRVAIADDHPVVRDGLALLMDLLPDVEVAGVAATGAEIVALADAQRLDVVLMDLRMPQLSGVEAIKRIRARHPETQIVVLTTYADDEEIAEAFRAGAVSYLTKDADRKDIHQAVTAAARGQGLISPQIREHLGRTAEQPGPAADEAPDGLTPREVEVLRLIAAGRSNGEIIELLHISEATIKTHINRVFTKTRVRDRAQAVRYAYRHGLASFSDT
ncbi:response regulator transcription factor [Amycolatopsis sp. H20-H5]|uniref:response regulator transcription factor n=1 Tax=Amycolatopsis sp. H20-H5 TaxID=3046309 RepID=UPI002DBF2F74|nr:response regulator transcription factor [Amycolatopsis sp. H20-H5]MEC3977431.1 response regulator transcription factor [Amycolatopsis sp. H20-H5]